MLLDMLRKKLKLDQDDDEEEEQADNNEISDAYLDIEKELCENLDAWLTKNDLRPSKIEFVYNPLKYARIPHEKFINRYCNGKKKVLFLGINPGPFGMAQTGVPFGEVRITKEWLEIEGDVEKPTNECEKRKITGFNCKTSEISGKKFWGLFKNLCETPEKFFQSSFVYNYCPLVFMDKNGKNITPDKLKSEVLKELQEICDEALVYIIDLLRIEKLVAIGKYAEKNVTRIIKSNDNLKEDLTLLYLKHPSPIIPRNQNWEEETTVWLRNEGLLANFQAE